ncbi:MAG: Fur family transcriptional regulator [Actinomycetes bacterium]
MSTQSRAEPGDWRAELRARGYRLTPQRQLVLDAVRTLGHSTPEEIAAKVQAESGAVNLSTVYRTLDLLEELGLVTHTHLGHGAPTYHPADESDHVHLVCTACGGVESVPADVIRPLAGRLRERVGFEVNVAHIAMHGRCAACVEAGAEAGVHADDQSKADDRG